MATDLLSTIRDEIAERMDVLRPLLAEHQRLLVAADALEAAEDGRDVIPNGATAPRSRRPRRADVAPVEPESAVDVAVDADAAEMTAPARARRAMAKESGAKSARAVRGAAREAILAALEHGSHTVGELSVVTAMSGPNINGNLRRLVIEGLVVKTEREGKIAWSLVEPLGLS
ncbi:MAG TPA: helix-turn-helix domain-containing protein [Solirubrobacteraceae bacterium]|jgi:hypothetical protein